MTNGLEGKLVRLENGAWARYRPVPMNGSGGMHVMVAVEITPEERERVERETNGRDRSH